MKPLKIIRTYFPSGDYINHWHRVPFEMMLGYYKWGDFWFMRNRPKAWMSQKLKSNKPN